MLFENRNLAVAAGPFDGLLAIADAAAFEDIDVFRRFAFGSKLHHEMTGQRHAGESFEADLPAEFDEKNRERDGNAFAIVDDFVEITVGAIVVIAAAAVITVLAKKIIDQSIEFIVRSGVFGQRA